ncbi:MAG: putative nucleotide-binding protein, sugar kinase/HSP70/actin superfamily [Deltaproteobacteria bacterium]|nr:putative nucleotide-binding protein, sugar kinase/HSP70/actin superfamily [Deltaproteobacteria bacterium]
MTKYAFYQIGTSAIATNAFARTIGLDTVTLPSPSMGTIARGVSLSPEFSCFPFKVLLGSLMQGVERGADVFVVPFSRSISSCQLADFGMAQKYILRRTGHEFDILLLNTIRPDKVLESFRDRNRDITLIQVSEGLFVAAQKLLLLEIVEDHSRDIYLAARKQKAEGFRLRWTREIDGTDSILDLYALGRRMDEDRASYPALDAGGLLKIAVIGDMYTINEKIINNGIFERLCDLGVFAENGIRLRMLFDPGIPTTPDDLALSAKARGYLRHDIGGFAQDTVRSAIRYAEKGFDGLVHIYPFSCMPEVVVRSILPKVGADYDIPILNLPIDEQTGDAGFTTRVEAFVDLIDFRRSH